MTPEKVKEVLAGYNEWLQNEYGGENTQLDEHRYEEVEEREYANDEMLGHLIYMTEQAAQFVDDGRVEKAMRWLGFIQGCLWATGMRSLEDLKQDVMP